MATAPTNRVISPLPGASPPSGQAGTDRLGKQEFLKLLIAQLRNQDPMKPMEDREFIAQLAQFSTLEALQSVEQRMEEAQRSQALAQAAGLIGKQVRATLPDGSAVAGLVAEVRLVGGSPRLVVDGREVDPAGVTTIGAAG